MTTRAPWLACLAATLAAASAGCGDNTPASAFDVTVSVDVGARAQVMQGFGASVAFYVNWLTAHPSKSELYDVVFRDLGLDILRVGNWYQSGAVDPDTVEVVGEARARGVPRLVMSSWSPPASLKSNNDTKNGGTLAQQANGGYDYTELAMWWVSALAAYGAAGVHPDYISIQNEPDFTATWESCRLGATETATRAGYGPALAAVAAGLQATGGAAPALLGPELASLANDRLATYLGGLDAASLSGVAHHLYGGGSEADGPDSWIPVMQQAAAAAGGLPLYMTEYAPQAPDAFDTAWLIHDAVTVEGVSAYLYWGLVWAPPEAGAAPAGLVTAENPFSTASWTTAKGYVVNPTYYALAHFARWTDAGWQRVGASSSAGGVKVSAFASPDGGTVTLVLLNGDGAPHTVAVGAGAFAFTTSAVYRTSGEGEQAAALGPLGAGGSVTLGPRAIATVVLGR